MVQRKVKDILAPKSTKHISRKRLILPPATTKVFELFNGMIDRAQGNIRKVPFKEHERRKALDSSANKRSNAAPKFRVKKKASKRNRSKCTKEEMFTQILDRISNLKENLNHIRLELKNLASLSDEQYLHFSIRMDTLDLGSLAGISMCISNFRYLYEEEVNKLSGLTKEFERCEALQGLCQRMMKKMKAQAPPSTEPKQEKTGISNLFS